MLYVVAVLAACAIAVYSCLSINKDEQNENQN